MTLINIFVSLHQAKQNNMKKLITYLNARPALTWTICLTYYLSFLIGGALLNNAFIMFGIPLLSFLLTLTIISDENY